MNVLIFQNYHFSLIQLLHRLSIISKPVQYRQPSTTSPPIFLLLTFLTNRFTYAVILNKFCNEPYRLTPMMLPKPSSLVSTFDVKIHSLSFFPSISSTFKIMNSCDRHSDLLYKNSCPYLQIFSLNNFKDFSLILISAGFSFVFTYHHTSLPTFFRSFSTRRYTQAFHNLFFDFNHHKATCKLLQQ